MSANDKERPAQVATRALDRSSGDTRVRRYDPAETKSRVLAAAYRLFSTRGFAATGTADIAREADVSEGSIFYHFGSKQKLLAELGIRHGRLLIEHIQGDDDLADLEPGIIVPRAFEFCRTNSMWGSMAGEPTAGCAGTRRAMPGSAETEPFYHAARDTMVEWAKRHMQAAFARRGITGVEIDLAATFLHLVVGEALDQTFATADPEEQARIERETIRFVRAACGFKD